MLGFFDSGLGGLTILKEVVKVLPEYSYIYLGDNARAPYGSHSNEAIYEFTAQGVTTLFRRGAKLVILACNSASAVALRQLQQDFLPARFPDRRILGVIIPTAEEIGSLTKTGKVGLLATEATVRSGVYDEEVYKIRPSIKIYGQACPLLVPIIEAGEAEWEGMDLAIKKYVDGLFVLGNGIDIVVLGCTHYPIIQEKIAKFLPKGVGTFAQGPVIARKLADYLKRHPNLERGIERGGGVGFLTTEDSERTRRLMSLFYGEEIETQKVRIGY